MKRIFLSGGGGASDSIYLDKKFVSLLNLDEPLIYIPVAMMSKPYEKCYSWFESVFTPLGVKKIKMLTDLQQINKKMLDDSAGIYIGGGNTVKLLNEVRQSNFDRYLVNYINRGKPVYGGSAGAIILGKDVRTAPEARELDEKNSAGLNILFGYSVYCHYDPSQNIKNIQRRLKHPLIAIPEKSGVYIEGGDLEVFGFEPIRIIMDKEEIIVRPGTKYTV
jgi:dipeptidase E